MSDAAGEIILGKLTRREFRERMQSGELLAAIIPVGAIEQHLEHLAMEHDWRSINQVATVVAERLRPRLVVAQGLMAGVSEHHMKHPGTISLRPGTFLSVLDDMISSMARAGFRHILVLNGHGGNVAPCRGSWEQLQRLARVNLHFLSYWEVLTPDDARELLVAGDRVPQDMPGHAEEFETALALAAFPENVRQQVRSEQPVAPLARATAANGRAFLERIVDRVAAYVEDMLAGRRVNEIPPYYP
jgi:creatinine amidohydrolase